MKYLNKILVKTRYFLTGELNTILYEATTSYEDKKYNQILRLYDNVFKEVLNKKNKIFENSSYKESVIFHDELLNIPFYRILFHGAQISNEKQREFYFTYIKDDLNLLILKGKSLQFENHDEQKKIEDEFNIQLQNYKYKLSNYLEKILVYQFYYKNEVKQKFTNNRLKTNTMKRSFEDFFINNNEFRNTIELLKKNLILDADNKFTVKYSKPLLYNYLIIAKLIEVNLLICEKGERKDLYNCCQKYFNSKYTYSEFNKYLENPQDHHLYKNLYFIK